MRTEGKIRQMKKRAIFDTGGKSEIRKSSKYLYFLYHRHIFYLLYMILPFKTSSALKAINQSLGLVEVLHYV
jgi:hypothetical protein